MPAMSMEGAIGFATLAASWPVMTANTPGRWSAFLVSIDLRIACARVDGTIAMCS